MPAQANTPLLESQEGEAQLRTIPVEQLTTDMFVAEIVAVPGKLLPKKKKGMIRDPRIIDKFVEFGVEQVVIDVTRGRDVESNVTVVRELGEQTDASYRNSAIEDGLDRLLKNTDTQYQDLKLEWRTAKEIFHTSVSIVEQTVRAVREGVAINGVYFNEAAKAISRSIMRNKDALTWLGKIRDENSYLFEHSVNTAVLMGVFAQAQGLCLSDIEQCINGALMHDLGQGEEIEQFGKREGPLTESEFEKVKQHTRLGIEVLDDESAHSEIVRKIILEHHERFDGKGYPKGLSSNDISPFGRMFAIIDTYDALTNDRFYKKAVPSSDAMRILLGLAGKQFDEALVHKFIKCMGVYPTGSLVKLNNGLLALVIAQTPGFPLRPLVRTIFNSTNDCYVEPRMMDLSRPNDGEKVLSYENPDNYGIVLQEFLPEEMSL